MLNQLTGLSTLTSESSTVKGEEDLWSQEKGTTFSDFSTEKPSLKMH